MKIEYTIEDLETQILIFDARNSRNKSLQNIHPLTVEENEHLCFYHSKLRALRQ